MKRGHKENGIEMEQDTSMIHSTLSKMKATAVMAKDKTVTLWKSGVKGKAILCAAAVLVLWIVWPSGITVDDIRREIIATLNTELSDPSCPARKRIEEAHVTVTVSHAHVLKCDITTIDGSDKAGANRANISFITVIIRFNWDGIFHKGGTTDAEFRFSADGRRCIGARIVQTDTLVNTEDPGFWIGVGALLLL